MGKKKRTTEKQKSISHPRIKRERRRQRRSRKQMCLQQEREREKRGRKRLLSRRKPENGGGGRRGKETGVRKKGEGERDRQWQRRDD